MSTRTRGSLAIAALLTVVSSQASAVCLPAKGRIANNAQPDGTTLGVVSLDLGNMRLKCAIRGDPMFPTPPDFKHTVVCDNRTGNGQARAQITLDSSFIAPPEVIEECAPDAPGGPNALSFQEVTVADPSTGRGAFQGMTGELAVRGTSNCEGAVMMRFEGELCLPDN